MRLEGITIFRPSELTAIDRAIEYTAQNMNKPVTAEDLSEKFYMPVKKVQAGIKRKTGYTLHEYLTVLRMKKAKELLQDLDYSIKEITKALGYKASSHFGEIFKELHGQTPSMYRTQYIKDQNPPRFS
jgi:two-component system response regulator YesN